MDQIININRQNDDVLYYVDNKEKLLYAMISPILFGLLNGLKNEVIEDYKGMNKISLRQLARSYKKGDGDYGVCFEYAVHSAIRNKNSLVIERIQSALSMCGIEGKNTTSILLGFEKSKIIQRINNKLLSTLTENSILISSPCGERIKIKKYLQSILNSFRRKEVRDQLPESINEIWKVDLFIGNIDTDMWAAVSVKSNPRELKCAKGLAIGIIPSSWFGNQSCQINKTKDMIICPLLSDYNFMSLFNSAWQIVQNFIQSDAKIPHESLIHDGSEMRIYNRLEKNRDVPVLELVDDDLKQLAQPDFISTKIITPYMDNNLSDKEDANRTIFVPNAFYGKKSL